MEKEERKTDFAWALHEMLDEGKDLEDVRVDVMLERVVDNGFEEAKDIVLTKKLSNLVYKGVGVCILVLLGVFSSNAFNMHFPKHLNDALLCSLCLGVGVDIV